MEAESDIEKGLVAVASPAPEKEAGASATVETEVVTVVVALTAPGVVKTAAFRVTVIVGPPARQIPGPHGRVAAEAPVMLETVPGPVRPAIVAGARAEIPLAAAPVAAALLLPVGRAGQKVTPAAPQTGIAAPMAVAEGGPFRPEPRLEPAHEAVVAPDMVMAEGLGRAGPSTDAASPAPAKGMGPPEQAAPTGDPVSEAVEVEQEGPEKKVEPVNDEPSSVGPYGVVVILPRLIEGGAPRQEADQAASA